MLFSIRRLCTISREVCAFIRGGTTAIPHSTCGLDSIILLNTCQLLACTSEGFQFFLKLWDSSSPTESFVDCFDCRSASMHVPCPSVSVSMYMSCFSHDSPVPESLYVSFNVKHHMNRFPIPFLFCNIHKSMQCAHKARELI